MDSRQTSGGAAPSSKLSPVERLLGKKIDLNSLREFDIYTKVDDDFNIQTSAGATISIIGWVLIVILLLSEVRNYSVITQTEHMQVDTTLGEKLQMHMNITYHALTCAEVHMDAMDIAGDNQINVEHDISKLRLSPRGDAIGDIHVTGLGKPKFDPLPANYCGSCFGAESPQRKCCNSCDELRNAYQDRGWSLSTIIRNSTQCLRDGRNPFANVLPGEGCRISGRMTVNKVSGNFHMAHGESIVRDGRHIHQFIPNEAPHFNVSHTIHHMSFGTPYNKQENPLDSASRTVNKDIGTGLFQYFLRIIPVSFTDEWGKREYTSTYTMTERFRPLSLPQIGVTKTSILPGVFFIYDIAPFIIEVKRERVPFSHFFSRCCAIVGGLFSILKIVDAIIHRLEKVTLRKSR